MTKIVYFLLILSSFSFAVEGDSVRICASASVSGPNPYTNANELYLRLEDSLIRITTVRSKSGRETLNKLIRLSSGTRVDICTFSDELPLDVNGELRYAVRDLVLN